MDKLSYALGLSMGNNFMRSGIDNLNFSDFAAGVEASYKGDHSQMSLDEAKQTVNRFFAEMENRLQECEQKSRRTISCRKRKTPGSTYHRQRTAI